jgi:hypothetical protein
VYYHHILDSNQRLLYLESGDAMPVESLIVTALRGYSRGLRGPSSDAEGAGGSVDGSDGMMQENRGEQHR